jgi:hypothetical protein
MNDDKIGWRKQSNTIWATHNKRGFVGSIEYITPRDADPYRLTITGTGAPAAADYKTLRLAKNAFRKFLHSKPV